MIALDKQQADDIAKELTKRLNELQQDIDEVRQNCRSFGSEVLCSDCEPIARELETEYDKVNALVDALEMRK